MVYVTDNVKKSADSFSIRDTNVLKGIAILLMLIHHLFYIQGLYDDIHLIKNHYLINELGVFSKLCVALFVFLSGYGLMVQTERKGGVGNLKDFYIHRFKKLFFNYWLIWIIFVPISYFLFDMTFASAYHSRIGWHLFADILGLHSLIFKDTYCYNPTWWFYSCIILLYFLFPAMYKLIKREALLLILCSLVISFLPIPFIDVVKFYIVAFALGMWMVHYRISPLKIGMIDLSVIIMACYCICRNFNGYPIMIDCVIALMIYIVYRSMNIPEYFKSIFSFLGKHSMNIFLFHTFIFHFWFKDIVYVSRNPPIILLTLLAICIPISIILEWIKKYTIYRL